MGELNNSYIKELSHDKVMESAKNFIPTKLPKEIENFNVKDIHYKYNELFLDNGAYSLLKNCDRSESSRSIKKIEQFIIKVQQELKPDLTVPFDFPFTPRMTVKKMEREWHKTKTNIERWSSEMPNNTEIVPALHAWNLKSVKENINWLHKKDYEFVTVGSILILQERLSGFFGDRQPTKNLFESLLRVKSIAEQHGMRLHIFGFGSSPLMYHLASFCEIDSSDSAGYRRKAAYGKIILPQTGERYAGNGEAKFGYNYRKEFCMENILSLEDRKKLEKCDCPECSKIESNAMLRWEHLREDWRIRAVHNKWVMDQEVILSEKLKSAGMEEYEKFLEVHFQNNRFRHLWNFVKQRKMELIQI